ncbi:MAG: hypothetical protein R3344_13275 [Acidobacteriota bacterium]|nr:hypothetical protein [Acidobacteriota bacterium]
MTWDVSNSTVIIGGLSAHAESLTGRFSNDRESADRFLLALDALALATEEEQIVDAMDRVVVEGIHGPAIELFRAAVYVAMRARRGAGPEFPFPNPYSKQIAKVVVAPETAWGNVTRHAHSLIHRIRELDGVSPGMPLASLDTPAPEMGAPADVNRAERLQMLFSIPYDPEWERPAALGGA